MVSKKSNPERFQMTIRVALNHQTSYSFDRAVNLWPHEVRLRPAAHSRTPILSYSLNIEPAGHFLNWQQDPFGNWVARLVFPEKAESLKITVDLVADMTVINPFDFFIDEVAENYPFEYPKEWVYMGRNWNENYFLRTFLMYNSNFEIILFSDYLYKHHIEVFRAMPISSKDPGKNLWLRKQ